ncbi:hypothetical protein ACFC96_17760 [Streptomyces sp. NPDC055955]|uniref:hypothetical protein n=1 Tax=Streptomyces sp. NPDC055955 TaxID=3345665 RepID=UPI0035DEA3CD
MLPADMAMGGVSAATAADLKVGAGVLKTFKQRVDTLLSEFEGSDGAPSKVGGQRIAPTSLRGAGTKFPEADGLYEQYNIVHERLTSLSKTLSLQIEAMGIAAHGAEVGYGNLEDEQRRRFWAIQSKIEHDQQAAEREKAGAPDQPRNDKKQSKKGFGL